MNKHVDVLGPGSMNETGSEKRVSVVICLNDESDELPDIGFLGGQLTFHGLIKNPAFGEFAYPIRGKAGTLIAFASTIVHEVTPVVRGTRYVGLSACY